MKKIVRTYYTTFFEVEFDDEEFESEDEMKEYARLNCACDVTAEEFYKNLSLEWTDQEIFTKEDNH